MKRILFASLAFIAATLTSGAQKIDRTERYDSFSSIEIADDFDVVIHPGNAYTVTFSADSRIADYCRVFRLGSLLKIDLDQSSFPKELKAQLKKKGNEIQTPSIVITMPLSNSVESITLKESVSLNCEDEMRFARKFHLSATDNCIISNLKINATEAVCELNKKASGKFVINSSDARLLTDNNASANVTIKSTNAEIEMEGSSKLSVSATVSNMKIDISNGSELNLNGKITTMDVKTKGNSKLEARSADVKNLITNLSNGECYVNVTEKLKIMLEKGAKLIYDGFPEISIDKINSSTVMKLSDLKEKKK